MTRSKHGFGRQLLPILGVALGVPGSLLPLSLRAAPDDDFAAGVDVGKVEIPGSSKVLPDNAGYRIPASGHNIWGKDDAFHFVARQVSGDVVFSMDVQWIGEGKA